MPTLPKPPTLPASALVADNDFAAAYEACSDQERAALKSCIARLVSLHGRGPLEEETAFRTLRQGGKWAVHQSPVPWAIITWDEGFTSPVRLLAAVMPAILVGVPAIYAIQVGEDDSTVDRALLAALELAGQEQVAVMERIATRNFAEESARLCPDGRLITLGASQSLLCLTGLPGSGRLRALHFPAPRIGICPSVAGDKSVTAPDWGYLRFAHPDATFMDVQDGDDTGNLDAVLCSMPQLRHWLHLVPLTLTPGCEASWHWSSLTDFFTLRRNGLAE